MQTKIKLKRCKVCKDEFYPCRPLQQVCSMECAVSLARVKTARADKVEQRTKAKELRDAKERLKSRRDWVKDAQTAFNAYIRTRDSSLPCISCQRFHSGQYHAGHYRTVGANPELRFNELNVHKQCAPCNDHLSGNLINYRINLVKKIGIDSVEWLEGKHESKHYTIDELNEMITKYKKLTKELVN